MTHVGSEGGNIAAHTYDTYFESGHYNSRYPQANDRILRILKPLLDGLGPGDVIDYGCGNGRYTLPVLKMSHRSVTAFDISAQSIQMARGKLDRAGALERVQLVYKDLNILTRRHANNPAAMVIMMFGVLSHIYEHDQRILTLRMLRKLLNPDYGRLILSVPNCYRRFRKQQKEGRNIIYQRKINGRTISLNYYLYDHNTLRLELEQAGYVVERVLAESLMPESWITNNRLLGIIDSFLSRLIPARFGYGLLAIACPRRGARV